MADEQSTPPPNPAEVALRDRIASHTVTNYLLSAYQGKFAFLNILAQLQYPSLNTEMIAETRQVLDQVAFWQEELWKGENLFSASWTFAETIDAQRALDYLAKLKPELYGLSQELERFNVPGQPASDLREVALLTASFGRSAYAREHSIKGFIEMGQKVPGSVDVNRYVPALSGVQEDIRLTHALLDIIKKQAPNFDAAFIQGLVDRTSTLPGIFRTQAHEVNQIIATYQGGLTFENAEFTVDEALSWRQLSVPPTAAGYWRAHRFSAEEAVHWMRLQTVGPAAASLWKNFGFHADTADTWIKSGFPPSLAKAWYDAGYDPKEARSFIERGVQDPTKVPPEKKVEA